MSKRPRPIYFQHLQKTAGTSLADTLRLFIPPERTATTERYLQELAESEGVVSHRYDFVTGHTEVLSCAPPDAFKVAVFRDPMARLLSARRQVAQAAAHDVAAEPPEMAKAIVALRHQPIAEVLKSVWDHRVLVVGFWNYQAAILGGWPLLRASDSSVGAWHPMHDYFQSATELRAWLINNKAKIADRALQSLQALDYVGLTEDFDNSVREIFTRIGLPEPRDVVVRNARTPVGDEEDPRIPEIAKEFIELDGELYEAAAERHAAFRRAARGAPADYIGHTLSSTDAVVISAGDAPGGHGWHQRHERPEGIWGRWTGPQPESRIALSAPKGAYLFELEMFGASSGTDVPSMRIVIEGEPLETTWEHAPSGLWVITGKFERRHHGGFEIVLRVPDGTPDEGVSVKEIKFTPIAVPSSTDIASFEEELRSALTTDTTDDALLASQDAGPVQTNGLPSAPLVAQPAGTLPDRSVKAVAVNRCGASARLTDFARSKGDLMGKSIIRARQEKKPQPQVQALALGGSPLKFQAAAQEVSRILKGFTEWQAYLSQAGIADSAVLDQSDDLHHQVVRFMASVEAVAKKASNQVVVGKCREFFNYFTEKCREFGTDASKWENGVEFARPSEDSQRVISDVVRETIEHLIAFTREHPPTKEAPTVERTELSASPVAFITSEDDSRKSRGYYYYGNDLAMVETHFDTHLLLDLCDLSLTPTILKTGWWEPWIDILLRSTLQPGMTYINAGANIGYHTMLGAKLVESYGKVFSFEANPHAYSLLKKSVYFNGFSGRTALFPTAVYDHAGETDFAYVREMLGGGGLFIDPKGQNAKDFQHLDGRHRLRDRYYYEPKDFIKVVVPVVTIDEAVSPEAETIDMLHMDIEGSEALALMGAKELIRRSRRVQLIIEWSLHTVVDEGLRDNYKRAAEFLAAENFRVYSITPPRGNVYTTPPDLRRIDVADLLTIPHSDLYLARS